jgi:ComF family protein
VQREDLCMLSVALDRCADIFDIIVPVRCVFCCRHETHVCQTCCERWARASLVGRAPQADMPSVVALGWYAGSLRTAVLGLKFRNRRIAAVRLGALLGRKLHLAVDAIVPVPLHRQRYRSRGFNQAEAIAQGIASAINAPLLTDAVVRPRSTIAQSSLALRERRLNVHNAFAPGSQAVQLRDARVLIVDDVVTSGATLAACASALRCAGVRNIIAAALAVRR